MRKKRLFVVWILIFYLAFLVQMIPSIASDIEVTPADVNILGVSKANRLSASNGFTISTNRGNIELEIPFFNINTAFTSFQRENFYKFGYLSISNVPRDISMYVRSDFPLTNGGCMWDDEIYNETWVCDHQFIYKGFTFDIEDVFQENPKMTTEIIKLDRGGKVYQINFNGITRFDPVVVAGGVITITTDYYTCEELDGNISNNAVMDCKETIPEVCELKNSVIEIPSGGLNLSYCTISNAIGVDKTGASALIKVKDGGYLELSYSGGVNSSNVAWENTIHYQAGSEGIVRDSYLDELGMGIVTNRHGLWLAEEIDVINTTLGNGKWLLVLNKGACNVGECEAENILIANNSFSDGKSAVKSLAIFGSDNNEIIGNNFYRFINTAIDINSKTVSFSTLNSDNNLIKDNYITGVGKNQIDGIFIRDVGNYNVINDNFIEQITRNLATKPCSCIGVASKYSNITDNRCHTIGGSSASEFGTCIVSEGDYSYINGSDCDLIGGVLCGESFGIKITSDFSISENNVDLDIDPSKACGFSYYIEGDHNYINENGLELVNNDDSRIVEGIHLAGNANYLTNFKITKTLGTYHAFNGIHFEGNDNIIQNALITINSDVAATGIDITASSNNTLIDSVLICEGADCGNNNEICDTENLAYALAGDYWFSESTAGTYLNTLLNTTYTEFCTNNGFEGDYYNLNVQWYLNVKTIDNETEAAISGINVTGLNVSGYEWFTDLSFGDGFITKQNLTEYVQEDISNTRNFNNYSINATDPDGFYNSTGDFVNMTTNQNLVLRLQRTKDVFTNNLALFLSFLYFSLSGIMVYVGSKLESRDYYPLRFLLYGGGLFMLILGANVISILNTAVDLSYLYTSVLWVGFTFAGVVIAVFIHKSLSFFMKVKA